MPGDERTGARVPGAATSSAGTPTVGTPIVETVHAGRVFGHGARTVRAVEDASISLRPNRTLGIVGTSGSGKSTLGALVGGFVKPTSGEVLFNGVPLGSLDRAGRLALRREVQFVFQDPKGSLDPSYTVGQILEEPLKRLCEYLDREGRKAEIERMIDRVGLSAGILSKTPGELSGGQCQRVAIARALLPRPRALVCDECTSALDVSVQAQVLNLLCDLQEELGCGYLFISHDVGVVGYMAHEVAVMSGGRIVERGSAREVLGNPGHQVTATLVRAAVTLAGRDGEAQTCC